MYVLAIISLLLTFWTSFVDSNNWLLVGRVDGLESLSLNTLCPFTINVQTEWLLVGDGWGFDLCCERHVDWFLLTFGIWYLKTGDEEEKVSKSMSSNLVYIYSLAMLSAGSL